MAVVLNALNFSLVRTCLTSCSMRVTVPSFFYLSLIFSISSSASSTRAMRLAPGVTGLTPGDECIDRPVLTALSRLVSGESAGLVELCARKRVSHRHRFQLPAPTDPGWDGVNRQAGVRAIRPVILGRVAAPRADEIGVSESAITPLCWSTHRRLPTEIVVYRCVRGAKPI